VEDPGMPPVVGISGKLDNSIEGRKNNGTVWEERLASWVEGNRAGMSGRKKPQGYPVRHW
jgi:hypothetical protein